MRKQTSTSSSDDHDQEKRPNVSEVVAGQSRIVEDLTEAGTSSDHNQPRTNFVVLEGK